MEDLKEAQELQALRQSASEVSRSQVVVALEVLEELFCKGAKGPLSGELEKFLSPELGPIFQLPNLVVLVFSKLVQLDFKTSTTRFQN